MTMKRDREEINEAGLDMAKCLMLLSKVGGNEEMKNSINGRIFTCKTCNKQFHSFQALGGHRASHKKAKLMGGDFFKLQTSSDPPKPKTHECSICGLEFAIGQALGGHMRRHKGALNNGNSTTSVSSSSDDEVVTLPLLPVPVLKKSNSSKRVVCNLELSLALPENYDDLKLQLGKICSPVV